MFLLTRLLDGIDGAYARATNQCTEFGGYLDIVVDFTVRTMVIIDYLKFIDIWTHTSRCDDGCTRRGSMDCMRVHGSHFLC